MGKGPSKYTGYQMVVAPPPPIGESARVSEQSLRMRLLRGHQEADVEAEIQADFASEVSYDLAFRVDLSENSFKNVWQQLAVAYDTEPTVTIDGDDDLSVVLNPGIWPKAQGRQLIQMAVNECLVRVDWPTDADDIQEVKYRIVPPSTVYGMRASRNNPDVPVYVCELRMRTRTGEDGRPMDVYTYESWDVSDPEYPVFKIEEDEDGERVDVTRYYVGDQTDYPYRDRDGRPLLPYVLYHKNVQSSLWNFMDGVELVRGTLRLSSAYTWWFDAYKNSSNPVRVAIDLELPAGNAVTMDNGGGLQSVVYSPKTILRLNSSSDRAGTISTFPPGMAPLEGLEALRSYAERLAVYAGLNPGDLQATGSAQSGIAIIVSRDGMRKAQLRAEPANRKGDCALLALAAKLANAYGGHNLPETARAYRIDYALVGQSEMERKTALANVQTELDMGLLSQVGAVRKLFPSLDGVEAVAYLLQVAEQDAALAATTAETVKTTLDATQSSGAREIIESVAAGKIPAATGEAMLINFFGVNADVAASIVGSIGPVATGGDNASA